METSQRILDMRRQLESVATGLGDESLEIIRGAVERGETKRPAEDKLVLQARRSVEKAIRCLERL